MPEHLYHGEELAVYEYLECGALGHSWDFVDSNHWTPRFGEPVTLRCMRCGMERRDIVMRDSRQLLSRYYIQPLGFKFAKGERPKRIDFVLMSIDSKRRKRVVRDTTIITTEPTPTARREVGVTRRNRNKPVTPIGNDVDVPYGKTTGGWSS